MRKEQYSYNQEMSCFMKNDRPDIASPQEKCSMSKSISIQPDFYSEWVIENSNGSFINCLMSKKQ